MANEDGVLERLQGRLDLIIVLVWGVFLGIGFAITIFLIQDVKAEVSAMRRDILINELYKSDISE